MDFSLQTYIELLEAFQNTKYQFQTFQDFIHFSKKTVVILRHDVDCLSQNALEMAQLEYKLRVTATYYFRMKPRSYDEDIIQKIASMDHEIGYHYENLSDISKRVKSKKELFELAVLDFKNNLDKFRKIYPVKTICMHGSPLSKWDNRLIWQRYDYRDFDIIGEPYFDIDFNEILYLTDTGRRWNGVGVSIRDKVDSNFIYNFKNTFDIINALNKNNLPERLMINIHPHRWTDKPIPWLKELIWQNTKNIGKYMLIKLAGPRTFI